MEVWEAIVLGLVQGLTEFLPVSSSGHLQIFNTLFGLQGEENLTFAVAVHAATVCSTIVVFRAELGRLIVGFFRFRRNAETVYVGKILLSMIPVAVVGLLFKEQVEALFASGLLVVGVSLILTAALLTFAYYARPRRRSDISFRDAFVIGIAQAFAAVLPGLSRSGSTIATGLLLGDRKEDVAKFSFLMVLIPILGEAFLDALKGGFAPAESGISAAALTGGFIAAFVSGFLAVNSYNIRISATQSYVPDSCRARFNGVFLMFTTLGSVIGQLAAGALAEFLPIRGVIAGLQLVGLVSVFTIIWPGRSHVKSIYNREVQ